MERFFTIFWLLLIPTQLGRHFWFSESSVVGIRIDYLSIILYLTDLVWLGWLIGKIKTKEITNSKNLSFKNLLLILFIGVNIILAPAKIVAIYRWLRIGQWYLTWKLVAKNRKEIKKYLKVVIPGWIILEAFLSLAQIVKGGSLNGIWWWLGERRFMYGGIGIAQLRILDQGWIRAYGTFSHPNSLAGFLLLAWWYWKSNFNSSSFDVGEKKDSLFKILYWVVNWSAVLGIVLSGSRVVWMLTVGLLVVEQILNNKREDLKTIIGRILLYVGILCLILGAISVNYRLSDFVGGWDINSMKKREMLGISALKMIRRSPLFGLGAGNFVVNLPKYPMGNFYWMQPVHNIFLLIWSEIGILGIIVLIFNFKFLIVQLKRKRYWWLWIIVVITGMFDHYWLTLPQNSWLLAIILGVI